jgi:hypothetical protein
MRNANVWIVGCAVGWVFATLNGFVQHTPSNRPSFPLQAAIIVLFVGAVFGGRLLLHFHDKPKIDSLEA